jgi:hypothetical protein
VVRAGEPERLVLGDRGDQLPALQRAAVVDHAQAQVAHVGVEREAEEQHLEQGRHHQRHGEPAVAADLAQLLERERPEATAEEPPRPLPHAFTCMRRIASQASA